MSDWIGTKEAARMLGVAPTTLRRWADEGKLVCRRTAGGHRRFLRPSVHAVQTNGVDAIARSPELREWVKAIRGDDVHRVCERLDMLNAQHQNWFEVADRLGEVATAIGTMWADGQLSVLDEHIISSRIQQAVTTLSCSFEVTPEAPFGFLTTISEEQHTLALSLAQLCMRSVNIDALIPRANMPVAEIIQHVGRPDADVRVVAVSASQWSSDPVTLARAYADLSDLCRGHGIDLILGGEGQWPDIVDYGYRCQSFRELEPVLESLGYLD